MWRSGLTSEERHVSIIISSIMISARGVLVVHPPVDGRCSVDQIAGGCQAVGMLRVRTGTSSCLRCCRVGRWNVSSSRVEAQVPVLRLKGGRGSATGEEENSSQSAIHHAR